MCWYKSCEQIIESPFAAHRSTPVISSQHASAMDTKSWCVNLSRVLPGLLSSVLRRTKTGKTRRANVFCHPDVSKSARGSACRQRGSPHPAARISKGFCDSRTRQEALVSIPTKVASVSKSCCRQIAELNEEHGGQHHVLTTFSLIARQTPLALMVDVVIGAGGGISSHQHLEGSARKLGACS